MMDSSLPSETAFRILNIGLDRDLLDPSGRSEAQKRQQFYAERLPAHITHIVKAPAGTPDRTPAFSDGLLTVWACPVVHFSLFPLKAARLAARLLASQPFDLIFAQEPFLSGTAGSRLSRRSGLPLVIGAYSDEIGNPQWEGERLLNRLVLDPIGRANYRRAAAIRADSADVAKRLRKLGFEQAAFVPFLITNADAIAAAHPDAVRVRDELLGEFEGPLLLTVARLEPVKDIPLLLDAFARVRQRVPGAVLAVVGDGREREALHEHARSKGIAGVRWLGWRTQADIPAYFQAADLFVLSSRHESSARVLSESMLAGLPVVTTDTSGAADVIQDRVTGRVVPVGDAETFAAAVVDLVADRERLAAMGERARAVAAKTVSAEAVIDGLRTLYASVRRGS